MRLYIGILCLLTVLMSGCGKEEGAPSRGDGLIDVKINLSAAETRDGAVEPLPIRYIVEIYHNNNKTLRLDHQVYSSGNITLRLPAGSYDFYFWADGDNGSYLADNLKRVQVVAPYSASVNRVCYAGEKIGHVVAEDFPAVYVSLTRPVARLNYINTGSAPAQNQVQITYKDVPSSYNVLDKTCGDFKNITATAVYDSAASDVIPFVVDYLFPAPNGVVDIDLTLNGQTKQMTGIPLKANFQTNITSKFN